ncbi:ATP-binding protein [Streptomyces sp. NPDC014995]|uniref:ATP-binding protein n=1 Tax=Streptomyces sp. NPDC014995 TaxID=3364936 RepID=UPI0037011FF3
MGGSAPRRDCHLPVETTSFVDRRSELAEGRELLARARLVTLTGPGGVGKTRLAGRIAAGVARAFPDGVRFVHLSGLHDPALVPLAVADALGQRDYSDRPVLDALVERVRERRLLLVVDNCEHLLSACAALAGALLHGTTGIRLLTTSRHRLGLTEEHLLDVRPLPVPDPDGDLSAADGSPALALFADRAAAVVPGFRLTAANRASVARLCRRLDGLPLAIELAAVRMRVLDVDQLLRRLDDRYHLLTAGSPTVAPRHQTLRAAVDWSHDLCSEAEQRVWARLSVLPGSFDLETAEAVCGDPPWESAERLVSVECLESGERLESAEHLESPESPEGRRAAAAGARTSPAPAVPAASAAPPAVPAAPATSAVSAAPAVLAVSTALAVPAAPGRTPAVSAAPAAPPVPAGPPPTTPALRTLPTLPAPAPSPLPPHDVLGAVAGLVDKSVLGRETTPTGEVRYRLLDTLRDYGLERLRQYPGEEHTVRIRLRDWMQHRAAACERDWFGPDQPGIVARLRADQDNLRAALDFSLTAPGEALAGLRLAGTLWFHWHACGAPREGRYWLDRALDANPEPTRERARALWAAGLLAGCPEDLTRGRRRAEQARDLARRLGDAAEAAHAEYVVGVIRLFSDDLAGALHHFRAGVERGRVPGQHLSLVGLDRVELACALSLLGRADEAIVVCEETRRLCAEHGERWVLSYVERMLALAHTVKGDWRQAERHGREALRLKLAVHDVLGMGLTLDLLARIAAEGGAHEHAAVLLGGADRVWADVDRSRWGSAALNSGRRGSEERARRALGRTAFRRAYERGAALALTDLVAHALSDGDGDVDGEAARRRPAPSREQFPRPASPAHEPADGPAATPSRTSPAHASAATPLLPPHEPGASPAPSPHGPAVRLTRREAQVAELVAEGLANQQIADRLVIARRTAEGHVERILSKLGFSNRSQIAAWVTAQR